MLVSEARTRANNKYLSQKDDVIFRVKKGRRAEIKSRAKALGMSLNAYLVKLIDRDMSDVK